MAKVNEETMWNPIEKAFGQARDLNEQAVRFARDTADEVRNRSEAALDTAREHSEAALQSARERSESTLKAVRTNLEQAQRTFEEQTGSFDFLRLPEFARKQLESLEEEVRKRLNTLTKSLDIANTKDVNALRRKITSLEKKVNELTREKRAA